ncbi:3864_t:CDS:2, partial [Scutellospora calospora]
IPTILLLDFVVAQDQDTDQQFDDYQNDLVAVIAVVFGHINLCAGLCVIYSAFIKWRASSLSISNRIPLYFSFIEICQLIPGTGCKILAYLLLLQLTTNMILMASIAMTTYMRIVKGKNISLGTYDWKLLVFVIVSSIIVTIPSTPALGPSRFWCMTLYVQKNELLIDAYTIFCVTFSITCFCYFKTLSTIFNIDRDSLTD